MVKYMRTASGAEPPERNHAFGTQQHGEHVHPRSTRGRSIRGEQMRLLLALAAIVCFVLSAFGVQGRFSVSLLPLGLALFAASTIVNGGIK